MSFNPNKLIVSLATFGQRSIAYAQDNGKNVILSYPEEFLELAQTVRHFVSHFHTHGIKPIHEDFNPYANVKDNLSLEGQQWHDIKWYQDTIKLIKENCPELIIATGESNGGKLVTESKLKHGVLYNSGAILGDILPDGHTNSAGPQLSIMKILKDLQYVDQRLNFEPAKTLAAWNLTTDILKKGNVAQELEIISTVGFDAFEKYDDIPGLQLSDHTSFMVLFGFSAKLPYIKGSSKEDLQNYFEENIDRAANIIRNKEGRKGSIFVGTVIRPNEHEYKPETYWKMILEKNKKLADENGPRLHFRVGFEDIQVLDGKYHNNLDLVKRLERWADKKGVEIIAGDKKTAKMMAGFPEDEPNKGPGFKTIEEANKNLEFGSFLNKVKLSNWANKAIKAGFDKKSLSQRYNM